MTTFGDRLKKERDLRELSQQELADRLNLSQSTIAYYEKNKKQPPQDTLTKIADFFGVSTDYLLGRTDRKNIEPIIQEEPIVQVLMRGKEQMSSNNYELFTKAVEQLTKAYMDKVDRELDGDK